MFEYVKPLTPKTLEYVDTCNGKLRGFRQRDIYSFLGVKYGECKRWQTATPVKPWKGIKNAVQFGPRMFPAGGAVLTPWDSCGVAHEAYDYAEDALNLNIWTPTIDKNAHKPVMVWIHGGGFAHGSAMEMQCHHGENQSRFGDVVVVQLNHRLNIFGFLDVSEFGPDYENSGNCGLSDLVLALEWVHNNIENFGGDPNNVLIHGQSGGGQKVTDLMQVPAADGLFHKVIAQSGIIPWGAHDQAPIIKEDSERSHVVVRLLLKYLNATGIEPMLQLTPEELCEAYNQIVPELEAEGYSARDWDVTANGYYVGYPFKVGFTEHAKTIPMMIGCTLAEFPSMRIFNKHNYTEKQQMQILEECFPSQDVNQLASLFKKAYPNNEITDAIEMTGTRDVRKSCIALSDLRAKTCSAPTYTYMFAHEFPQDGGRLAWHCSELPVIFHNSDEYPPEFKEGVVGALEDAMAGAWAAFAHNSNPNNNYLPVEWSTYKTDDCETLIFDDEIRIGKDYDRELVNYRNNMDLSIVDKYTKFSQTVN